MGNAGKSLFARLQREQYGPSKLQKTLGILAIVVGNFIILPIIVISSVKHHVRHLVFGLIFGALNVSLFAFCIGAGIGSAIEEGRQRRYKKALKLISDINEYIFQDGSGAGYDKQINTLVNLSPDSVRCIYDIWSSNAPASEYT
jgi:hypothetical protein